MTVLEASDTVGGKLALGAVDGVAVELGAESVLARRPEAVRLAERVGLATDVVHPVATGALLWTRGRLRRLPRGQLMGIPVDLRELAAAEILSLRGLARIPLDSVLPGTDFAGDRSLGAYVASRVGREVVDRLVEPLLGGVYAGHADDLSLDAVLPQLAGAVRVERSLLRGARRVSGESTTSVSVFAGVRGGLGRLPAAVAEASGATVLTRQTVRSVEALDTGWRVVAGSTRSPRPLHADAVVLAVPAVPAARLLDEVAGRAADELRAIPYASVAIVTLLVPRSAVPDLPSGTGLLVPPIDGRLVKATTFSSQKWGWTGAEDPGVHVIRASVGRYGEEQALQLDDDDLILAVLAELAVALGWPADVRPRASMVTRWGGALPQYLVGHLDRVARIRTDLQSAPGLVVCGAAYDGVGIPACIASGEAAAGQVLRLLGARRQWGHGFTNSGTRSGLAGDGS